MKRDDRFYGRYRGVVTSVDDPEKRGRLTVRVPDVFGGGESGWAEPSLPLCGGGMLLFAVPPVGARVWIEFEQGDAEYPVWVGCLATANELPAAAKDGAGKKLVLATAAGHTLVLDGNGVEIKTKGGARIAVTDNGIELSNGKGASLKLSGSTTDINDKALEVS